MFQANIVIKNLNLSLHSVWNCFEMTSSRSLPGRQLAFMFDAWYFSWTHIKITVLFLKSFVSDSMHLRKLNFENIEDFTNAKTVKQR